MINYVASRQRRICQLPDYRASTLKHFRTSTINQFNQLSFHTLCNNWLTALGRPIKIKVISYLETRVNATPSPHLNIKQNTSLLNVHLHSQVYVNHAFRLLMFTYFTITYLWVAGKLNNILKRRHETRQRYKYAVN